jgi:hypothetical protein
MKNSVPAVTKPTCIQNATATNLDSETELYSQALQKYLSSVFPLPTKCIIHSHLFIRHYLFPTALQPTVEPCSPLY